MSPTNLTSRFSTNSTKLFCLLTPFILLACSEGSLKPDVSDRPGDPPSANTPLRTLSAEDHCQAVMDSVSEAELGESWVTCDGDQAYIHSDLYPRHEMMTGIVGTNEQIPVPAPGYYIPIKFEPAFTGIPQTRDSSLAVAINGIPIFDYSAAGELGVDGLYYHQPHLDTTLIQQLDVCGGHTGRGDDYHYHEIPRCMIDDMANKDDNPIIGWAFDGFPLYGNNNPDGSVIEPGTLDVCNGQLDKVFGYRYHTSDGFPYIIQCLVGEVGDLRAIPTVASERPIGVPVLVDDLVFEHDDIGNGLLTYNYEGNDYYLKSTATDRPECFDFEWKTVTNGGVVESGEYCHRIRTSDSPPPPEGMGGPDGMGAPGGMGPQ